MLPVANVENDAIFLLIGDADPYISVLDELLIVSDPEEEFDAVVLLSPMRAAELNDLLVACGRALAPILDFSGEMLEWCDFRGAAITPLALAQAMGSIQPILERTRSLPDISNSPDQLALRILALAYTRGHSIEAKLDGSKPDLVQYPLLRGISNSSAILADLANAGLLRPRFFERLHVCSKCKSARVNAREECTSCRSSRIEEVSLIHHYQCGYQGSETDFANEAMLVCPKCNGELRHYAVDYDRPGVIHRCIACEQVDSIPAVGFICADCENEQDATVAETRDWFHYDLLPNAVDALGTGLLPYRSLQTVMTHQFGAIAVRDFVATARVLGRIAVRYDRPLTGLKLELNNLDEIRAARGTSGLAAIFSRMGEVVTQVLRDADIVTAVEGSIYVVLPETPPEHAESVMRRIEERIGLAIAEPMSFSLSHFDEKNIPDLSRELS